MAVLHRVFNHLILGLTVLLLFLLSFEPFLRPPELLVFMGRFHPLILHFPIVLIIVAVINSFTREQPWQHILLPLTTSLTLITALTGFFLSMESGTRGELLIRHQWLGAGIALMMAAWYGLRNTGSNPKIAMYLLKGLTVVLILVTGHYGGMVTHGPDFLTWPSPKGRQELTVLPDDPLIYDHLVQPVLKAKCISCHNENKSKGGLILSGYSKMLEGGDSGPGIDPDDPGNSEVLRRIRLPIDDEAHMPPPEKKQLTAEEIALFEGWVNLPDPDLRKVSDIDQEDAFFALLGNFLRPSGNAVRQNLPPVNSSRLTTLSSDYITIRRIADESNAISVMLFPNEGYEARQLTQLQPLQKNIVELKLSSLPLGEEEMVFISNCTALEWLEIDHTPVDNKLFEKLKVLSGLRVLKAHGTSLSDEALAVIREFPALQKLYLWNTGVTSQGLKALQSLREDLEINTGIDATITFDSRLPAPVVNPRQLFFTGSLEITLEHPLEGVEIYYTTDGGLPDPQSLRFTRNLRIDDNTVLKYMAAKEGWISSPEDSIKFYKTAPSPDQVSLRFLPDPKYPGKGVRSLFDLEKGTFNLRDSAWLGFQQEIMELTCSWDQPVSFQAITFSSFINTGIHVFPPRLIEIYGGDSGRIGQLAGRVENKVLEREQGSSFNIITCPVAPEPFSQLTIRVIPLAKLPDWHTDKGKPGWFFVDEVVLVE